jgi:PAS domain S-box-containing protein
MVVAPGWMLDNVDGAQRVDTEVRADGTVSSESRSNVSGLNVGDLFDRLLDAVVIARLSTGRIVEWNAAAERLFGFTAQEAIGQPIEILMPEPVSHLHRGGLERYLRTGHGLIIDAISPVEMPARTKTDEQIRVELSLSEIRNADGERFAIAVIRDALHRKRLELTNLELVQARVARAEAEAELATRDELLEALTTALHTASTPEQVAAISTALADYRQLHNGELPCRAMEGELVDLVHAAVDAVRHQASHRRLLVFTPPSVPALFDGARTRQLLGYLLADMVACIEDGARLEVHVDQPTPDTAQLTLRAPVASNGGGPRLGTQLARALAVRQKGTLSCSTTPAGGLEAILTLPATHKSPVRRTIPRPRRPQR